MAKCFSFTESRNWCYRYSFSHSGLKSSTVDLGDGTIMHCWVPKTHKPTKLTLCLLHGIGANAMWQWAHFISKLVSKFNVYVPDLLFFGDSYTTRSERSEAFQATCVMGVLEAHGVERLSVVGISYGGFVGYSLAAQFKEKVERVVLIGAGVCLEEKDMEQGLFKVKNIDEAAEILLPQRPEKMKELLRLTFYKPPKNAPSCFFNDFIEVMCTQHIQERKELLQALLKGRKLSDLPKITQPTLIIWGDHDQVFPPELAHRLKSHLGENAELKMLKNTGHAVNVEKPKEMYKHLKAFLIDQQINHTN
ncbi:hypothetical protein Patl1_28206 [Pistacia atlantica]|uniref:Uncharacterized protein n=2 Tax=Pistacia atlantica TaxID=434234 RepID=A0ACC1BF01_9ROSI|nr:hypothetical protein Patl1_28199 [Pistacia atlantica]KAJ0097527.1 hypothetical protein Patl1_28206 [Pistacia atlantica]